MARVEGPSGAQSVRTGVRQLKHRWEEPGTGPASVSEPANRSADVNSYQELLNIRFAGTVVEKAQTIIVNEDNFTEISLPKDSPSLHLIQRLRNEAHRFAITYHRKLRSKALTENIV